MMVPFAGSFWTRILVADAIGNSCHRHCPPGPLTPDLLSN